MKSGMHCESDKLDEKTMGRIAIKLVVRIMAKEKKVPDAEWLRREIPNVAKQIGEKPEEIQEFFHCITPSIVGQITGCKNVEMSDWENPSAK